MLVFNELELVYKNVVAKNTHGHFKRPFFLDGEERPEWNDGCSNVPRVPAGGVGTCNCRLYLYVAVTGCFNV